MTRSMNFALLLCSCACTWELLVAQSFNYYACADSDYQGIFQFSCSDPTKIISVTSALIGYSDKYNGQTTPVSCPWTSITSATCDAIGFSQCSIPSTPCPFPCNCTAETTLPAASCIRTSICSFGQTFLLAPQNTALCLLSKNANFVSVNYTCTNPTTSATSQTMTSTTITTTKLTSTSSAVRSSTSTSTASVTYLPPSQSSSALSPPTVSTSTSFSVTVADSYTVQTSSHTTSTTANALSPGYHNRWNRNVQVPHPNLWIFIRKLKDEQRRVHRMIGVARSGHSAPRRQALYRRQRRLLRRLKRQCNSGTRSLQSYWRAVAHTVHAFG